MLENVNGMPRITCARFAYGCGVNSAGAAAAGSLALLHDTLATAIASITNAVLIRTPIEVDPPPARHIDGSAGVQAEIHDSTRPTHSDSRCIPATPRLFSGISRGMTEI